MFYYQAVGVENGVQDYMDVCAAGFSFAACQGLRRHTDSEFSAGLYQAGATLKTSIIQGALLALILGGGALALFLYEIAIYLFATALNFFAPSNSLWLLQIFVPLVVILLTLFIPLYFLLGIAHGRVKALHLVLKANIDTLAPKLADTIADCFELRSCTPHMLPCTKGWLSVDTLSVPLGGGRTARKITGIVLQHVPLMEIFAQWQQEQGQHETALSGTDDQILRTMLKQRIEEALRRVAPPSRKPFWIVIGAHALVLSVASLVPLITEPAEPEPTLSAAEILLRDVPPELAFEGALQGKAVHFVVQDCKVYRINGALKNREAFLVVEPESYPFFTVCDRQFLKAEGAAVTVWLGRMAFGAGGCCATGGTFRTTDGRVWKKISNDSSPWRAAELNGN